MMKDFPFKRFDWLNKVWGDEIRKFGKVYQHLVGGVHFKQQLSLNPPEVVCHHFDLIIDLFEMDFQFTHIEIEPR